MDREIMRQELELVRGELVSLDEQRVALEKLLRAYEGWLRAFPENGALQPQGRLPLPVSGRGGKTKGTISFNNGFIEVVRQARGEPLYAPELWRRMQEIGVRSDAKNPLGIIAFTAKRFQDVAKVGPRTWRWVDPNASKNGEWHQGQADTIPAEGGEPND